MFFKKYNKDLVDIRYVTDMTIASSTDAIGHFQRRFDDNLFSVRGLARGYHYCVEYFYEITYREVLAAEDRHLFNQSPDLKNVSFDNFTDVAIFLANPSILKFYTKHPSLSGAVVIDAVNKRLIKNGIGQELTSPISAYIMVPLAKGKAFSA